jgi:hypothetical protein
MNSDEMAYLVDHVMKGARLGYWGQKGLEKKHYRVSSVEEALNNQNGDSINLCQP